MAPADRPLVVSVVCADQLIGTFGLGVCHEVFGYDRRAMGLPRFDFGLVAEVPGIVRTDTGLGIVADHGFDRLERSARFPELDVDPAVLYVDNGSVITGAGTAAGVDTLLHLVRREWGAAAANALAREMVVPPHRDGGQAQFIDAPVAECQDDLLGAVLEWAQNHLADDLSVELLARRALMSPRSFARRFKATTGTTPHAWLLGQRLAAAEALLEESDAPVEEVARLVGFGTAAGLREQFARRRGVSPRAYRQTFRAGAVSAAGAAAVQLDRHRAGGVRGDQTLLEA